MSEPSMVADAMLHVVPSVTGLDEVWAPLLRTGYIEHREMI